MGTDDLLDIDYFYIKMSLARTALVKKVFTFFKNQILSSFYYLLYELYLQSTIYVIFGVIS